jgi:hypothetical protein
MQSWPSRQIVRFGRLINSPDRGEQRVPLAIIANLTGVSHMTLYRTRFDGLVSAETTELLTPIVRAFEAGKLRFRRSGLRSREPNHWELIDT